MTTNDSTTSNFPHCQVLPTLSVRTCRWHEWVGWRQSNSVCTTDG